MELRNDDQRSPFVAAIGRLDLIEAAACWIRHQPINTRTGA